MTFQSHIFQLETFCFNGDFMVIDSLLRLPQLSQKVPAETAFEAAGDAHFVSLWLGEGLDL